jgi:hypothetical protein
MGTKKKSGGSWEKSNNPSYVQEQKLCNFVDLFSTTQWMEEIELIINIRDCPDHFFHQKSVV